MTPSKPPILARESFAELTAPLAGIDLSQGFQNQMPAQMPTGDYSGTTPVGINVRSFEPGTSRMRGGSRPGLAKYIPRAIVEGWIVQELNTVVGSGYPPPGGQMQLSNSGRVVTICAVSQGNLYVANVGDDSWSPTINATGNTPPLNFTGIMFSAANNEKLWIVDGVQACVYDPSINTLSAWTASSGLFPVDSQNNFPRLICTWRGRTVLSGLLLDGQDWFMSAVGDPTNFNYNPTLAGAPDVTPTQAVAGENSPQGLVGDVITSLCPYSNDILIFFGDHSIYMMAGDPMANGQLDLISDQIGGTFGICWCKDPFGNLYFLSNKTGLYMMQPGNPPQRISQQIEQLLQNTDTGDYNVRLQYDDRFQGIHVFIAAIAEPTPTQHLFYELRTGAWWQEQFQNTNHDPLCCTVIDGNNPGDRWPVIGSWDGYVRQFSPDATDDDGYPIESSVVMGPLLTKDFDDVLFKDIQALLGAQSGEVSYGIYVGPTAEAALASTAVASGTWTNMNGGRNLTNFVRRAGHALYVKITSSNYWAIEGVKARIAGQGKVRRRGV
jgi:hypothetical protein